MKKFLEEHELEVLLILVTMIGITSRWIPAVSSFDMMYGASQWVLSYDYGLIRRGFIGSIVKVWLPFVSIEDVRYIALVAYGTFLVLLLAVSYALLKFKDNSGRLLRLMLLFIAAPATLSMVARDLGRFDIFLTIILFLCLCLISMNRHMWLIPMLMITAMFIHESFLILYVPTILTAIMVVYLRDGREKRILATLVSSAFFVVCSFIVLYKFGDPKLGYEEFSRVIQSRATFHITDLSIGECYYGIKEHYRLASSSLYDAGSIANVVLALLMLSPVILVFLNLWGHAIRNCKGERNVCLLLFFATLSGFMVMPIATDYGRWISAVTFCNIFIVFFLVSRGVLKVEELTEYSGGSFAHLFVPLMVLYLLFGPFHDWNPYPYRDNLLVSSVSIISVLFFDVAFLFRRRSLRRSALADEQRPRQ